GEADGAGDLDALEPSCRARRRPFRRGRPGPPLRRADLDDRPLRAGDRGAVRRSDAPPRARDRLRRLRDARGLGLRGDDALSRALGLRARPARRGGRRALPRATHVERLVVVPWARPRRELLLLTLVGVAALTPIYRFGEQDRSRLCLTEAIGHGRVSNDPCLATALDRSNYGGHLYSDKAPGMSLLQLPAADALRLGPEPRWGDEPLRLWGVRDLSSGRPLLAPARLAPPTPPP